MNLINKKFIFLNLSFDLNSIKKEEEEEEEIITKIKSQKNRKII